MEWAQVTRAPLPRYSGSSWPSPLLRPRPPPVPLWSGCCSRPCSRAGGSAPDAVAVVALGPLPLPGGRTPTRAAAPGAHPERRRRHAVVGRSSTWCSARSRRPAHAARAVPRARDARRARAGAHRARRRVGVPRAAHAAARRAQPARTACARSRSRWARPCTTARPWATSGCTRRSPRPCCSLRPARCGERPRARHRRAPRAHRAHAPTTTLAAPFCAWLLWSRREREPGAAPFGPRQWLAFALPVVAAAALHAAYNQRARQPAGPGYHYILMGRSSRRCEAARPLLAALLSHNLFGWLLAAGLERQPVGARPARDEPAAHHALPVVALWPRKVTRLEWLALVNFAVVALRRCSITTTAGSTSGSRFALDGIALALLAASFGAARAPLPLVALLTRGACGGAWGLQWFKANFLH